eukprot:scaffold6077_cov75-Skeletonema_menzelii.AAC.5
MMKLSTIPTLLLFLSSEAYASESRRMRSVKIYSSTPQRNAEFGKDIVDPYIGLPDEREERGLKKDKNPSTEETLPVLPTLEMSMPSGTSSSMSMSLSHPPLKGSSSTGENGVVPNQRGLKGKKPSDESVPAPTLEMSMPTGASLSMPVESFSYSLEGSSSSSTGENDILIRRRAAEEETYNGAMMTDCCSAISAATIVTVIVGVVALV